MVISDVTTSWPEDSTRVDVNHEDELVFWTNKFHTSPLRLRQAVRLVGSRFKDVSLFLENGRLPERIAN
jgi:hypothetical protein